MEDAKRKWWIAYLSEPENYHGELASKTFLGSSSCKVLLNDPMNFGNGGGLSPSLVLSIGSYLHDYLAQEITRRYNVMSPQRDYTSAYTFLEHKRKDVETFEENMLTFEERDNCEQIAENLLKTDTMTLTLENPKNKIWIEEPFVGTLFGKYFKAKPDLLIENEYGELFIYDYKTTASLQRFSQRGAISYGYDMAQYIYCSLVEALWGRTPEMYFIALEKTKPHGIHFVNLHEEFWWEGKRNVQNAVKNYNTYIRKDEPRQETE